MWRGREETAVGVEEEEGGEEGGEEGKRGHSTVKPTCVWIHVSQERRS